ncbi:thiosulfate oxidation carrier complex protein SoxZ [Celeribacter indicus]|uniref:Sulfur oxidation Z protein n=1 Tax=Celeribacter indicus TaxID=1208324 RepID=A0A0B5DYM5_9RHOB|nr:thiosulfate oxidation carrier complex protein SoxZ [Celeribacter indicus]AJE46270.1 sulfur oxidation Z protein [Celeribacter indicus]SDW51766.1 sulfur-oxidizing protein SoxZ [Celeribacter indicus]
MADGADPRVKLPASAAPGEVITIRTLISHPMESGQRKDGEGNVIPRSIINRFTCAFNGAPVIDIAMEPAIAAAPWFSFDMRVPEAGEFRFAWHEDDGSVYEVTKTIALA